MRNLLLVSIIISLGLTTFCDNKIDITSPNDFLKIIFHLHPAVIDCYEIETISLGIAIEIDGQIDVNSVQFFKNPKLGQNKLLLNGDIAHKFIGARNVNFFLTVSGKKENDIIFLICSDFIDIESPLEKGLNKFDYILKPTVP